MAFSLSYESEKVKIHKKGDGLLLGYVLQWAVLTIELWARQFID
jgi:hypothetical protein